MGKSTIIVKRDSVFVQVCGGPIGKSSDKVCFESNDCTVSSHQGKGLKLQAGIYVKASATPTSEKVIYKEPVGDLTLLSHHQDMILSHEEGDPLKWVLILQTMSACQSSDEVCLQLGLEIKPDTIVSYVKKEEEQEQVIRDYTPVASNALKREAYDISENIEEWEKLMTSVFSPNRVETMVNKYQKVWDGASAAAEVSFADDRLEMMEGVKVALVMANKLGSMMKQLSGGVEIVGGSVDDYF